MKEREGERGMMSFHMVHLDENGLNQQSQWGWVSLSFQLFLRLTSKVIS